MSTPAQPTEAPNSQTPVSPIQSAQSELKEWTFGDVVDFRYKFDGYEGVWRIQFSQSNINQTLNSLLREIGNNIMGSLNVPDTHEISLDMKVEIQPEGEPACAYTPIRTLRGRTFLATYTSKIRGRNPGSAFYDSIYPVRPIDVHRVWF